MINIIRETFTRLLSTLNFWIRVIQICVFIYIDMYIYAHIDTVFTLTSMFNNNISNVYTFYFVRTALKLILCSKLFIFFPLIFTTCLILLTTFLPYTLCYVYIQYLQYIL